MDFNYSCSIILIGVSRSTREHEIRKLFQDFGPIELIEIYPEEQVAVIDFIEIDSAIRAFQRGGVTIDNVLVRVDWNRKGPSLPHWTVARRISKKIEVTGRRLVVARDIAHIFGEIKDYTEGEESITIVYRNSQSCVNFAYLLHGSMIGGHLVRIEFLEHRDGYIHQRMHPTIPSPCKFEYSEVEASQRYIEETARRIADEGEILANELMREDTRKNSFLLKGRGGYNYFSWMKWCCDVSLPQDRIEILTEAFIDREVAHSNERVLGHVIDKLSVGTMVDHKLTLKDMERYVPMRREHLPISSKGPTTGITGMGESEKELLLRIHGDFLTYGGPRHFRHKNTPPQTNRRDSRW